MTLSRRGFLGAAAATPALAASPAPFTASWDALARGYTVPDWFRDAKFGIWAHWSAQCVPEFGDWYGRHMYIRGHPVYEHHLKHYGHPSRTGFMEIDNLWHAENWEPEHLIGLYKAAGAKYFMALGCHHDNLDTWASSHHEWNTLRVGPKRDLIAGWAKPARAAGLKFAISNHSSHAWHWWQTAYGYDPEGPEAGKRYDAYWLGKDLGAGKWWAGLDPQKLYTGRYDVPPDGIATDAAMNAWRDAHDRKWTEDVPPGAAGRAYAANWLARQREMVERYRPDMVYFDDTQLPFGQIGLDAVAHYYNQATRWHGAPDVVATGKKLDGLQNRAIVEDVERGFSDRLRERPWQTDTCIGDWHYDRRIYERHGYKPARMVVQRLCDAVSKNGNLMLSIPMRGDGTHDPDELAILADLGRWFAVNGAAIYGTRPWRIYGEGPTKLVAGMQNEDAAKPFTAEDVRFTVGPTEKGGHRPLHAFLLEWPTSETRIAALGTGAGNVEQVTLLGGGPVRFRQDSGGLSFTLPGAEGGFVPCIRIDGHGLT